ncbi:hypothetical protein BCR44DRAFT_40992 [Catenaria anguillulae PL171]|uniref:BRISC and BRCA1-A complex member 1 n=1 Tax=Catenaria anguillulae PL171 TaxID=765915 RepID=A0A1Y2HPI8_9FUNG|nr:hypothetical protein BCR44DRAFT_40992 [Catenaria anguillulae PL171]
MSNPHSRTMSLELGSQSSRPGSIRSVDPHSPDLLDLISLDASDAVPLGPALVPATTNAVTTTASINRRTVPSAINTQGGGGPSLSSASASKSPFSPARSRPETPTERILSSLKELRIAATASLSGTSSPMDGSSSSLPVTGIESMKSFGENVDENIFFCIDLHDENDFPLNPMDGERTRLDAIKELLKRFVHMKQQIKQSHRFGIITLQSHAQLYLLPTGDQEFLFSAIDNLATTGSYVQFDMTSVFSIINEAIDIKATKDQVFRIVFIYSRSNVFPDMPSDEAMVTLYKSGRVFFDLIYIHDPPNDSNFPQEIYNSFVAFRVPQEHGQSWFFECSRSWKRMATALARLLAHPNQRAHQTAST